MGNMPIAMKWDGESLSPANQYWAKKADEQFVIGQLHRIVEEAERSQASHNGYFAALHDAYLNLPESYAVRFIDETHFRKWALIRAGFSDLAEIVLSTPADASKLAQYAQSRDSYAVVVVSGNVVRIYTAKSQSKKAMGAAEFQRSKTAVLDVVSNLIGVSPDDLMRNAGKAA